MLQIPIRTILISLYVVHSGMLLILIIGISSILIEKGPAIACQIALTRTFAIISLKGKLSTLFSGTVKGFADERYQLKNFQCCLSLVIFTHFSWAFPLVFDCTQRGLLLQMIKRWQLQNAFKNQHIIRFVNRRITFSE